MKIHSRPAREVMGLAERFYARAARETSIDPNDILVFAEEGGEWLGVVRLCKEHGHYLLRTMQVLPALQGRSIGSQIRKQFAQEAAGRGIKEMHLIAFDYLERFYGQVGFEKVDGGPGFLMDRRASVARKSPDKKHILMRWTARAVVE